MNLPNSILEVRDRNMAVVITSGQRRDTPYTSKLQCTKFSLFSKKVKHICLTSIHLYMFKNYLPLVFSKNSRLYSYQGMRISIMTSSK